MIAKINLNSRYGRYAIRLALSCFIVVVFYQYLHIEHGYWAAFSVIACVVPTAGQSLERSRQRILGTFVGMVIGIVIAHVFGSNPFWIDILITVCVFLTVYLKTLSYSYYVTFNTVIAVLFVCLIVPGDWQVAIVRLEMTIVGVLVAICATYLILPIKVSADTPLQLQDLRSKLLKYYLSICRRFVGVGQNNVHQPRLETFAIMQNTAAIIKESNLEFWSKDRRYQHYESIYIGLENIYQILLILETDVPVSLEEAELQDFIDPVRDILSDISLLFNQDAVITDTQPLLKIYHHKLQKLLDKLQQLRINAVSDTNLPMATFKNHIQLFAMLNDLHSLVTALQTIREMPEPQV